MYVVRIVLILTLSVLSFSCLASTNLASPNRAALASLPAFPGAEGYGSQSVGGRGGKVIEVTNLDDSGNGSLRACVEASGPRSCVFRVGGIEHQGRIAVRRVCLCLRGDGRAERERTGDCGQQQMT